MSYDTQALDFDAIQRLLETFTLTPYGAAAARDLEPPTSIAIARKMQRSVTAAREALEAGDVPALKEVPNIRPALRQVTTGSALLSASALLHIQQVMEMAASLEPMLHKYPPLFAENMGDIKPAPELLRRLGDSISTKGQIRPEASPELQKAWAQYIAAKRLIEEKAAELIKKEPFKEAVVAGKPIYWRGARLVLVIRATAVELVKGVRCGSLMSPQEQLVEPIELIGVNNQLERLSGAIHMEEQQVLREISEELRNHAEALERLLDVITWIDLAVAGGKLSAQLSAHAPTLTEDQELHLNEAYHPLLIMQYIQGTLPRPVSLSLKLNNRHPYLLVTGPNAGGKTIALKTVGLLTLMAMCGLHIPAEGDCKIGWYSHVLVDLGDKQSLYHHLSTFAAQVEMMKRMLNHAADNALLLFDELGSGTDPDEGAALAMAMLDELIARGSYGMVNTHLSPLKDYSNTRPKVQNACMLFDKETLTPTFKLKLGETGESYGLTIASKNGLPAEVIDNARVYLKSFQDAVFREALEEDAGDLKNGTR